MTVFLAPYVMHKEQQGSFVKNNYLSGSGIEWPELNYHLSIESMLMTDIKKHAA